MKIILLCFCFFALKTIAQEKKQDSTSLKRFQLGILYSADFSNKHVGSLNAFTGGFGNYFGLNLTSQIKRKIRVDCGVILSNYHYRMDNVTFGSNINPQKGFDTIYKAYYQSKFIEIPIKLNYSVIRKNRSNLYLIAGVYPSFMINSTYRYDAYPVTGGKITGTEINSKSTNSKSIYLCRTLGVGFEYQLNPLWNLALQFETRTNYIFPTQNGLPDRLVVTGGNLCLKRFIK